MTQLQIGLIGLCSTGVVAVVVYNTWQEYRYRKLAEQILKGQHSDVLLNETDTDEVGKVHPGNAPQADFEPVPEMIAETRAEPGLPIEHGERDMRNGRIEPVFLDDQEPREPIIAAREASAEPEVFPEVAVPHVPAPALAPAPAPAMTRPSEDHKEITDPVHLLSPVIDYVVAFEAVEPAPAYQILQAQRDVLARIHKPVHWIGYNEYAREWEPIIDDGTSEYRRVRVGLQLVDRKGPVGENDLTIFHVAMQDLADELMAIADMPPRQPALQNSLKLDEFCVNVDIQVGINVISQGQVFPGTKLRALAEAAGMVIDAEGRFVRCDDEGNVLFVLLNQENSGFSVESMKTMNTHGLTFLLDVPRVSHGERVFNQMVDLARRFADVLRGALVDDNHRPLSEGALEPIRRQVGQYQSMMAAHGLPAGGPLTRRLFS